MNKKYKALLILLLLLMVVPFKVFAETKKESYKRLDYLETLEEEEIEPAFEEYKPKDDAITIYMFRGLGCAYCRAFLNYMNSITDEYGQYFKMETFEVWHDSMNQKLMAKVSSFLEQPASGVPYVIIGDTVFAGFNEAAYGEAIKNAIKTQYELKKGDRYDVFEEIVKSENAGKIDYNKIILWGLGFTLCGTLVTVLFVNFRYCSLLNEIRNIKSTSKTVVIEKEREEEQKKVIKKHK